MLRISYQDVCRFYKKDFWGVLKSYYISSYRLTRVVFKRVHNRKFRIRHRKRRYRRLRRQVKFSRHRGKSYAKRKRFSKYAVNRRKFVRSKISRRFFKKFFFYNRFELLKLDTRRYVRKKRFPKSIFRFHNKERLRLYFLDLGEHSLRYYLMSLFKARKNFKDKVSHVFEHFGARLDHLLYLTKFTPSLFHSRVFLSKGWFLVNNKISINFKKVPSPGSLITINPVKLSAWRRFRRKRIFILYKNFLRRLRLRLFYRARFQRKRRRILKKFIFPRRSWMPHWKLKRRYSFRRVKRFSKRLFSLSKRTFRRFYFNQLSRVKSLFFYYLTLFQITAALKHLLYLSSLLNTYSSFENYCVDNDNDSLFLDEDKLDIKFVTYLYYAQLRIFSLYYRVFLKLNRKYFKKLRIRYSRNSNLIFFLAPFQINRFGKELLKFSKPLSFNPWLDLGLVFRRKSSRFFVIWKLYEASQFFHYKPRKKRFKRKKKRLLFDAPLPNMKFMPQRSLGRKGVAPIAKSKRRRFFVYRGKKREYGVAKLGRRYRKSSRRRKKRLKPHFIVSKRKYLKFLLARTYKKFSARRRRYLFSFFGAKHKRRIRSGFWLSKLRRRVILRHKFFNYTQRRRTLKLVKYSKKEMAYYLAKSFSNSQRLSTDKLFKSFLLPFLTDNDGLAFKKENQIYFSYFFFDLFYKIINRVIKRINFLIKFRYQLYRRTVVRGFRKILLRPYHPHYMYENNANTVFYFGVRSKFHKRYAKIFFFPSRINLRSFSFFYFSRKSRPVLKTPRYRFFAFTSK